MNPSDFTGARRIPLVGRHNFLEDARQHLRQGGAHLLYFEGDGGIGKTALLETIMERSRHEGEERVRYSGCVAGEIIDLYHVDVHTPEGLIRRIVQVLDTASFRKTQNLLNALDWARSVGDVNVASEESHALHAAFLEEFGFLAEDGVVLAFDTMEVLEYERDAFQEGLGTEVPILSAGQWLFESFFPAVQGNVLLLLAGRPDGLRQRLHKLRERRPHVRIRHARVGALQENEVIQYLQTVAQAEGEQGDFDAAARLWDFADERGDVVHFLTGGRPILLALVADLVAHGWTLPTSFGRTLDDLSEQSPIVWSREIESALVVRIQESPSPIGEAIHALAWLRKGATPALLARVMALNTADGSWDLGTAQDYLEEVAQLTLVKVRSGDGRVFLHDELYALMGNHILQECSQAERDRVYQAVLDYYDDLVADLGRRVDRSSVILPLIHARLRQAYVEQMHYRLCHRPALGFAMYFWLAEEALGGRDAEMDMLLHTELLRTVRLLDQSDSLDGLDPKELELDAAVRWGMRALFLGNDPDGALEIFDKLYQDRRGDAEDPSPAWTHMRLYQAAARIERAGEGDWQKARKLLYDVVQEMDEIPAGPSAPSSMKGVFWWAQANAAPASTSVAEGRYWLSRTLGALALNYEGYLDQQQGRYAEAMAHYQASAMLQRRLAMAGLAPTLTNLSHTMALIGQFQNARLLAQEAERWARHSGKEYVLAQALNARALVEIYDNHYRDALRYTDQALKIAEGLRTPRVRGMLFLTRTRAQRYLLLGEETKIPEPRVLDDALKEANQAVNLLKSSPPDRVMALVERGCLLREVACGYHLQQRHEQADRAAGSSQRDLERAAALADALDLPDQQAQALVALAWLWYQSDQIDEVDDALRQVYPVVPSGYRFPRKGELPPMARADRKSQACMPFWSVLGKAEMLNAFVALDQAQSASRHAEQVGRLQQAVRAITLSLAYEEQIADAHFDMTRAEASLHRRILHDRLSIAGLHQNAQQVAEELDLSRPTRFQSFMDRMFGPADLWT